MVVPVSLYSRATKQLRRVHQILTAISTMLTRHANKIFMGSCSRSSLSTLLSLFIGMRPQIVILKSFLTESIDSVKPHSSTILLMFSFRGWLFGCRIGRWILFFKLNKLLNQSHLLPIKGREWEDLLEGSKKTRSEVREANQLPLSCFLDQNNPTSRYTAKTNNGVAVIEREGR